MPDTPAPAAPTAADPYTLTPDQAGVALAQKTAAYQQAQIPAGSVAPPPPGVAPTTPAQARALLAARKSDPQWRNRVLAGSGAEAHQFQEWTALAASGDVQSDTLIETVDAVSGDPNTLRRSHYEGLVGGLREGGLNDIAENYLRDLDSGARTDRGTEGDKIAFKTFRDRLMRSPDLREKYLDGSSPKLTSLMNALNRVIALSADDGRPISAEGRELLSELEKL